MGRRLCGMRLQRGQYGRQQARARSLSPLDVRVSRDVNVVGVGEEIEWAIF